MKKTLLSLSMLLSAFSMLNAQCVVTLEDTLSVVCGGSVELQTSVTSAAIISPTTNTLNQIHFFDPDHGFIAGENGTILRSTDIGQTWELTTFLPDQNWVSINFTSPNTGFIVSVGGKIAKTTDGGVSWNVVFDDPLKHFTKIKIINATTGLAIGEGGLILKTIDGGNSWNLIPSGTSACLNDILFVNSTKGFICGDLDVGLLKNNTLTTSDAGDTWSDVTGINELFNFHCMAFANENVGYVSSSYNTYKTTDGGITWAPSCYGAGNSIALWNDSTGFLCSDYFFIKFLHSGSAYEYMFDNLSVTFHDVACPDDQTVFVISNNGGIYAYRHLAVIYKWEPSTGLSADNIANPVASPDQTTTYKVTAQLPNGNTCADSVIVYVNQKWWYSPDLCMVTVDSATSHNRIIWNIPVLSTADSVYVYKEGNISGQNIRLAVFPASQSGEYIDEQSDPVVKSDSYSLSVLDKCSFEYFSYSHTTMHLSINQGIGTTWNLIWQQYSGAEVLTYNIYRGSTLNNFQLTASVSGSISQYTDLNAPSGDIYYLIEAVLNVDCSNGKSAASSFSNLARYIVSPHGIGDDNLPYGFSLVSNPVTDMFSIPFEKHSEISRVSLLSLNGNLIMEWQNPVKSSFDISHLSSGLYLLKIDTKGTHQSFMQKLVKL